MTNDAELEVVTLFVEDVDAAKAFYVDVLGTEVLFADEGSAVVKLSNLMINLLGIENAPTLVEPMPVGPAGTRSPTPRATSGRSPRSFPSPERVHRRPTWASPPTVSGYIGSDIG